MHHSKQMQRTSKQGSPLPSRTKAEEAKGRTISGLEAKLLQMQRSHGNQAVQRYISQYVSSHPHAQGSPAQAENRTGMPDGLKSGLESLSGMDLSDVRVHYNSSKPAQMQAFAYAQSNDIYIGPGQEQHLPHEGWHVVQQRQGRVRPTMQLNGTAINDDPSLEQDADRMGALAMQQSDASGNIPVQAKLESRPSSSAPVQLMKAKLPFKESYVNLTASPLWDDEAKAFETRLGSYCFHHPRATSAAKAAILRMGDVLMNYYAVKIKDVSEIEKAFARNKSSSAGQIGESANVEDLRYLLYVDGSLRELMTAFYNAAYYKSEEKMEPSLKGILHDITLRDNWSAADKLGLDKKGLKKQSDFLKGSRRKFLQTAVAIKNPDKAYLFAQDIFALGNLSYQSSIKDADEIKNSQKDRKDRTTEEKAFGPEKKTPRDYALMGTPLSARERAFLQTAPSEYPLLLDGIQLDEIPLEEVQYQENGKPLDEYELKYAYQQVESDEAEGSKMMPVLNENGEHQVEKAFKKVPVKVQIDEPRASDLADPLKEEGPELPLQWTEGTAWFRIDPASEWYKAVHDRMGAPVVAGVSGTTTRMMSAFQWLNVGVDPLDFRMAIMGWMLPSWDHSLYEIIRGGQISGVQGKENLAHAIDMYANIAPFTPDELRNRVCKDRMFPHEHVYMKMAHQENQNGPNFLEPGTENVKKALTRYDSLKNQADTFDPNAEPNSHSKEVNSMLEQGTTPIEVMKDFSPAHAVAISGYTGGMHAMLNAVMTLPPSLAKREIRNHLNGIVDFMIKQGDLLYDLSDSSNQSSMKKIEELGTQLKQLSQHPEEWTASLDALKHLIDALANPEKLTREKRPLVLEEVRKRIDEIAERLIPEMQLHANMTVEALNALPPVTGVVWRGDWMAPISWTYGFSTISFDNFASTSKIEARAVTFANVNSDSKLKSPVLLELELKGKGGRDISYFSVAPDEAEVLLMPGTKFSITQKPVKRNDGLYHIKATEI